MNDDERWMSRALELAERGRGSVEPNPLVGAVIVQGGAVVGEGWHARYGGPHAEVAALAAAGKQSHGATLYVTLEPCCHHGKTPPCTGAVIRAGIGRVVVAMADPFPEVAGQGLAELRRAGIAVEVGVCQAQAAFQNAPYLTLLGQGRPYVHAKWAMSLDGRLAARTGDSKWISGGASRAWVHALRGRMDAIIVGAGTVRADDPLLTARPPGPRTPARIILAGKNRLPPESRLFTTPDAAPTLIAVAAGPAADWPCEVVELPGDDGRPSVAALLQELGRRRMTNVLVEGGSAALGSFAAAGCLDEVHVFIAPLVLGGGSAALSGWGVDDVAQALRVPHWEMETIGDDLYVHGWLRQPPKQSDAGR